MRDELWRVEEEEQDEEIRAELLVLLEFHLAFKLLPRDHALFVHLGQLNKMATDKEQSEETRLHMRDIVVACREMYAQCDSHSEDGEVVGIVCVPNQREFMGLRRLRCSTRTSRPRWSARRTG